MGKYFVTAICTENHSKRTFGYFDSYEEAHLAITRNHGDIHERLYDHVVMELFGPGIHPLCAEDYWFKWCDGRWHLVCRSEIPEIYQNPKTVNFAIG